MTFRELRKAQYDYNYVKAKELGVDIGDFRRSPYTFLKIRFYLEISTVLVYFLQKTKIKPNTISIIYGLMGILGGILLAIPNDYTIISALFIFFTKTVLDATDGFLARVTNQTSLTGHILDNYGAHLNALGFQIGFGFYVAGKADLILFYYLIPLIPFFYATRLTEFARRVYYFEYDEKALVRELKSRNNPPSSSLTKGEGGRFSNEKIDKFRKYYKFIWLVLDDRARTIDFICLLILVELYTPLFVTGVVFSLLVIKQFIIFAAEFYVVSHCGWAEKKLHGRIAELFVGAESKE